MVKGLVLSVLLLFTVNVQADTPVELAAKIHKIRECVSFSVTSWYRSSERNRRIGGAAKSLHMDGLAMDVVLDDARDVKYFIRRLDDLNLEYRDEGDHIHISVRRRK